MGLAERHAYRFGYLQSEHWQNLRIQKLAECDARCFFCGKRDLSNDVHHVHYPRNLFTTETKMLRVLCREHHEMMHKLMEKYEKEYEGKPAPKSKHGRDFVIYRRSSVEIENKIRNAGGVCHSNNGRPISVAEPEAVIAPKAVDHRRKVIERIAAYRKGLRDIIKSNEFGLFSVAFQKRCDASHRGLVELHDILLLPSEWAEEQNRKLLDSLGIESQ